MAYTWEFFVSFKIKPLKMKIHCDSSIKESGTNLAQREMFVEKSDFN